MFCKNFASNFLSSGKFSTTLKLDSEGSLEPLVGLWGKNLEEKHQQAPILLRGMVYQRTKYIAFPFRRKKAH
jgi:hypothetical protein